jgi:hypothetical protein
MHGNSSFPGAKAVGVYKQPIPITLEDTQNNTIRSQEEDGSWFGQRNGMGKEYEKIKQEGRKNSKGILEWKTEVRSLSRFTCNAVCGCVEVTMICEAYNKACLRVYWVSNRKSLKYSFL